jgi:hypothetical protein
LVLVQERLSDASQQLIERREPPNKTGPWFDDEEVQFLISSNGMAGKYVPAREVKKYKEKQYDI